MLRTVLHPAKTPSNDDSGFRLGFGAEASPLTQSYDTTRHFCLSFINLHTHTHTQSVHQWSGRLGFNSRSSHTKDFKKWYLIPPWLTLSIIRYVLRVKWSNPGKRVASSPTPRCCSNWKGSLRVALDYSHQRRNSQDIYILTIFSLKHVWSVQVSIWHF